MLPNKKVVQLLVFFIGVCSYFSFAQTPANGKLSADPVVFPRTRVKTDVFILNTCDPIQVSLRRKYDNDSLSFQRGKKTRRLEVLSTRLSSFKIEGINPLRYKYYINSEAVTQFMDASIQNTALNQFIKDGYFMSPFDITVPQIFKEDIERTNQRASLEPFEQNIRNYKDSLYKYKAELNRILDEYPYPMRRYDNQNNPIPFTKEEQEQNALSLSKSKAYRELFDKWESKLNDQLENYERHIMTLPISSSSLSILRDYKNRPDSSFNDFGEVRTIEKSIQEFALNYDVLNNDFKSIDSLLNVPSVLSWYSNSPATARLIELLRKYGFTMQLGQYSSRSNETTTVINVKEFLIKKRYQVYEEFVLGTATKIGIMLQSNFRQLSQNSNSLKMQNCLDEEQVEKLKKIKTQLSQVFDFVQKTSAEFQILVSYLDIDNKIYSNIAKSINTHYYSLLLHLKNLDFIELNNMIEFTLPSSTNLKNIDLIRYKIEREDKITGGKQSYVYDLWVRGGLKVDFSFGIFASGLVDNEYQKHVYDSVGTITDSIQINRVRSGGYNFGFGGMVNITPRMGSSWITPGISVGVIYSTNQKLQFVSSLALHLGKTERIILHAGFAAGFVKTLDFSQHHIVTVENKNTFRVKASLNEFTIPTIDKFTVRQVFGITYNLSKKNALQAVASPGLDRYRELNGDGGTKIVTQN